MTGSEALGTSRQVQQRERLAVVIGKDLLDSLELRWRTVTKAVADNARAGQDSLEGAMCIIVASIFLYSLTYPSSLCMHSPSFLSHCLFTLGHLLFELSSIVLCALASLGMRKPQAEVQDARLDSTHHHHHHHLPLHQYMLSCAHHAADHRPQLSGSAGHTPVRANSSAAVSTASPSSSSSNSNMMSAHHYAASPVAAKVAIHNNTHAVPSSTSSSGAGPAAGSSTRRNVHHHHHSHLHRPRLPTHAHSAPAITTMASPTSSASSTCSSGSECSECSSCSSSEVLLKQQRQQASTQVSKQRTTHSPASSSLLHVVEACQPQPHSQGSGSSLPSQHVHRSRSPAKTTQQQSVGNGSNGDSVEGSSHSLASAENDGSQAPAAQTDSNSAALSRPTSAPASSSSSLSSHGDVHDSNDAVMEGESDETQADDDDENEEGDTFAAPAVPRNALAIPSESACATSTSTTTNTTNNPRKSARRHSGNDMKTPDEECFAAMHHQQRFVDMLGQSFGAGTGGSRSSASTQAVLPAGHAGPSTSHAQGTAAIPNAATTRHAITASQSSSTANLPLAQPFTSDRRLANEETRPARRKVSRLDGAWDGGTGSETHSLMQQRSVSEPLTTASTARPAAPAAVPSTAATKRADGEPAGPTFQNQTAHRRPGQHAESYFPSSDVPNTSQAHSHQQARHPEQQTQQQQNGRSSSSNVSMQEGDGRHAAASISSARGHAKLEGRKSKGKQAETQLPHLDIATFPTTTLLQLLAALLTKITLANDAIRDGVAEAAAAAADTDESKNSSSIATSEQKASSSSTATNDAEMHGAEGQDGQSHTAVSGSGTVTPPAEKQVSTSASHIMHRRVPSQQQNEPVTPAVPFPSPAMSRNRSSSQERKARAASKMAFATAAGLRLTAATSSEHPQPSVQGDQLDDGELLQDVEEEEEDPDSMPRSNFSRPPAQKQGSGSPEGGRKPTRLQSNTILTSSAQALATPNATLCFHARNIPSINIEAYLIRISKYCPTTNEVFISLLVYFDRMSRLPSLSNLVAHANASYSTNTRSSQQTQSHSEVPSQQPASSSSVPQQQQSQSPSSTQSPAQQPQQQQSTFAVDSFNIHRLIIAGVTVASKFFSDIFYTNSRYAKVGGLPLPELNALELQFLLLNGFDLTVQPAELQKYADYLMLGLLPPLNAATEEPGQRNAELRSSNAPGASSSIFNRPLPTFAGNTTTPGVSPPNSQANTPSRRTAGAMPLTTAPTGPSTMFAAALRNHQYQHQQPEASQTSSVPQTVKGRKTTPPTVFAGHGLPDPGASRPKTSSRSASESSTSASEASTVVPSESSVDTERGGHSTADESTGDDGEEEADGDSRMTDMSNAPSPAPTASQSQQPNVHLTRPAQAPSQKSNLVHSQLPHSDVRTAMQHSSAAAVPKDAPATTPSRPPVVRGSSSGSLKQAYKHPLLASTVASNAGQSTTESSNRVPTSGHRRENSRTREWTIQQQRHRHVDNDDDADMADEE